MDHRKKFPPSFEYLSQAHLFSRLGCGAPHRQKFEILAITGIIIA